MCYLCINRKYKNYTKFVNGSDRTCLGLGTLNSRLKGLEMKVVGAVGGTRKHGEGVGKPDGEEEKPVKGVYGVIALGSWDPVLLGSL